MNKPRIFISTVTREFKTTRQRIAAILIRKGYEPEWQDTFGTEPGDLRAMLRAKVGSCAGLIQIVGDAYGAEPPEPDAQFGRCSYTQFEFLHARALGKKTWLLFADGACQRDTTPDQLDLPLDASGNVDTAHADPAAYQAERRQLQREYRQRPEVQEHLRHTAESDLALDLAVERLDDELAVLRKEFATWQRTVLRLAAALILLTTLVLGTQLWMKRAQDKANEMIKVGPKITTAGLRKQILLGSERKRDRDLAEAENAEPAEREKLRQAALDAYQSRNLRLDELAQSFTELEGRADATAVFREMMRILELEGVDFALAYIAEQQGGILDRIRQREANNQQQTRTELQSLLAAARLQGSAGQSVAARAGFRLILTYAPAWPDALSAYAWFLRDQSVQSERHGTLTAALADAEEAHTIATRLHTAYPASPTAQRLLSATHHQMGDVLSLRQQEGDSDKVLTHFARSLDLAEALVKANPGSAQAARDVSVSLSKLGDFLAKRGQPGDADQALGYFTRCNDLRETLLKANPGSAEAARDVSLSLERLGDFLAKRGQPGNADQALGYYTRSLDLRETLLKANAGSAEAARDVSVSLDRLGDFLAKRGQPGDTDQALGYFTRSLDLADTLLKANPGSAEAARNVSVSLERLGDFLAQRGQPGDADQALDYFTRCNDLLETLLKANPGSAEAARDVSASLVRLGDFLAKRGQPGDADQALDYFTRCNDLLETLRKANPGSAEAARDVSVSLERLGDFLATRGQPGDADQALGYFTRSLDLGETLLKANPGSAEAARDVVVSHYQMAALARRRGDAAGAEQHSRAIYEVLKPCIERGMTFDPPIVRLYEGLKARFSGK